MEGFQRSLATGNTFECGYQSISTVHMRNRTPFRPLEKVLGLLESAGPSGAPALEVLAVLFPGQLSTLSAGTPVLF